MTKRMIQDYFNGFRWKKIVASYRNGNWWMFINFLFLWPIILDLNESGMDMLAYFMIMLPILFAMFAAPLHSLTLPKLMYLCPMSRDERKEYIVRSSYIRIFCPSILGLLGVMVLVLTGSCDVVSAVGIMLNCVNISALVGYGVNGNGYGRKTENGQRVLDTETSRGIWEAVLLILGFCMALFYLCILRWNTPVREWVKWLALGITVLIQLPATIKYMKYWKEAVKFAEWYETGYAVNEQQRN